MSEFGPVVCRCIFSDRSLRHDLVIGCGIARSAEVDLGHESESGTEFWRDPIVFDCDIPLSLLVEGRRGLVLHITSLRIL